MEERVPVKFVEREGGKKFYYVDLGREDHGKSSVRVWVSSSLVEKEGDREVVKLYGKGRRIIRTEKGSYVMKPNPEYNVFLVGWKCGYRGESSYEIVDEVEVEVPFKVYESERGSLGVSHYALASTKADSLRVRLRRSGRTYGKPKKKYVKYTLTEEGRQDTVELLPDDDEELIKLLEEQE